MPAKTEKGSINSIQKACRILSCFSLENSSCNLTYLCNQTGFAKSTVYRICNILVQEGFVHKSENGFQYTLTEKVFALGVAAAHGFDFKNVSQMYLNNLAQNVRETASIFVENNFERLCVAAVESPSEVRVVSQMGKSFPIYLGASGRVLLTWMDPDRREEYLRTLEENPPRDLTIPVQQLRQEIEDTRKRGYAVTYGERIPNTISIATPIFYSSNQHAALTVSAPNTHLAGVKMVDAIEAIRETAKNINLQMQ
ncbi:MAG: IclR family transcriptional regulator [Lachnospiraceae bacterium]|nr:IclR family transcriptional regulator [Lachnospiraceae bacterium]